MFKCAALIHDGEEQAVLFKHRLLHTVKLMVKQCAWKKMADFQIPGIRESLEVALNSEKRQPIKSS